MWDDWGLKEGQREKQQSGMDKLIGYAEEKGGAKCWWHNIQLKVIKRLVRQSFSLDPPRLGTRGKKASIILLLILLLILSLSCNVVNAL